MGLFRKSPAITVVDDVALDDEPLRDARDAVVATGDWHAAADLLGQPVDVALRHHRINTFAEACVRDETWIARWLTADSSNIDARIIWACSGPLRAWAARGGRYASETEDEAFQQFFEILEQTGDLLVDTLRDAPNEPALWCASLWHGIGTEADPEEFDRRWQGLCAIDPVNRLGHIAALQYVCEKWLGSHDEMYAFAREVFANTPTGSPIAVSVLQAHIEYWLRKRDLDGASPAELAGFMRSESVNADIDAAMNRWFTSKQDHPSELHDRSVLIFMLCHAGRWKEAKEQLDATGLRVFEYPWYYDEPKVLDAMYREIQRNT